MLLSIFHRHPLRGVKRLDYQDTCRVYSLMSQRLHLTVPGLAIIRIIHANMNQRRPVTRTMSHSNLLSLFVKDYSNKGKVNK